MNKFLKLIGYMFLICFSLFNVNVITASAEPNINAQGSILIDASTDKILFGKNENKTFEPASTTKVMTAILALENCKLDDTVTVTQNFTSIDGTAIGLLKGDVLTMKDLLSGLLMESGNDCANAIAIHISGNIDKFGKLMTERAKKLGATHTTFKNPSGLPQKGHLTTPHDLALILKEAIKNKDFMQISTTMYKEIQLKNSDKTIFLNNKNHMINKHSKYYYKYAISGKNGYTTKANHTYVCAAKKDDQVLVAAFLNAQNKNQNFFDMQSVLNYGFDNYSLVNLYKKDSIINHYKLKDDVAIAVSIANDVNYVTKKGEENNFKYNIKIESKNLSKTSFNKGDAILKASIYVNDKKYKNVDLIAEESYEYVPLISKQNFPILSVIAGAIVGIILIFSSLKISRKKRKKRKKYNKSL